MGPGLFTRAEHLLDHAPNNFDTHDCDTTDDGAGFHHAEIRRVELEDLLGERPVEDNAVAKERKHDDEALPPVPRAAHTSEYPR